MAALNNELSPWEKTIQHAKKHGWNVLNKGDHSITFYRWKNNIRHEVHVIFDRAGRVRAWGRWENVRISIDQDPELRGRLNNFLQSPL